MGAFATHRFGRFVAGARTRVAGFAARLAEKIRKRKFWLGLPIGAMVFVLCLASCGKITPVIQVTNNETSLTIVGTGFSPTANCAQLSITGLPPPNAVLGIGQAECNGGSFTVTWHYSYAFCSPSDTQQVTILAVDDTTLIGASQPVSFAWGPSCNLSGFCGNIGQRACNGSCVTGGVGPDGNCALICGGEGQPLCSNGVQCLPGLNPNLQGGQVVCTAACGHAIGSPCTPSANNPFCGGAPPVLEQPQSPCLTVQSGLNIWACYGSGITSDGSCFCQPNTNPACGMSPSPGAANAGLCLPSGSPC